MNFKGLQFLLLAGAMSLGTGCFSDFDDLQDAAWARTTKYLTSQEATVSIISLENGLVALENKTDITVDQATIAIGGVGSVSIIDTTDEDVVPADQSPRDPDANVSELRVVPGFQNSALRPAFLSGNTEITRISADGTTIRNFESFVGQIEDVAELSATELFAATQGTDGGIRRKVGDAEEGCTLDGVVGLAVNGNELFAVVGGGVRVVDGLTTNGNPCTEVRPPLTSPAGVLARPVGNELGVFAQNQDEGSTSVFAWIDGQGAAIEIAGPTGASTSFGAGIAVGNFDGAAGLELAVSDPEATVDGGTGAVYIFNYDDSTDTFTFADVTLYDPEGSENFGAGVGTVTFDGQDVLTVLADGKLYTYFRICTACGDARN